MPDLRVFLARRARVARIFVSTTRMFKGLLTLLQQDFQHLQGRQGFGCAFSGCRIKPSKEHMHGTNLDDFPMALPAGHTMCQCPTTSSPRIEDGKPSQDT
jgi:hypothetical protein